ncbi:hypothetical protein, partial [Paraburkholderia sp. J63]|uniref:hypothetical protein n=1 Tax=Paraburkholderia sp. J63 TaxID=2805434 RepID=UPI002ABD2A6B
ALPVTILGLLGIAFLSNAADQTYWWFAVGLATACIGAPSYTALGYAEDPLRAYSVALLVSLSIAAAASYALPLVVLPRFGDKGVLVTIAALFALGAPLVLKLSYNRPTTAAASSGHAGTRKHGVHRAGGRLAVSVPILAALAGGIFTGVISGSIYDFVGPLASAVGIGAQTVGAVLAASLIAAIAAPMLPSLLGARIPDTSMISMSTVAVLLTYPAMMSHSPTIFATGFVVHCFFGTLGYTYYLGVVRRLDFTDRVYVAYPALQLVCIAGGTALAGFVLARFAPAMLFAVSAIAIGASWFAIVAAQRLSTRFRSA